MKMLLEDEEDDQGDIEEQQDEDAEVRRASALAIIVRNNAFVD